MRRRRICKVDGCEKKAKVRGFCTKHYYQKKRSGELEKIRPRYRIPTKCIVEGCEEIAVVRGFCGKHYKRWHDTGSPYESDLKNPIKTKGMAFLSPKEKIEEFSKEDENGCWIWQGSVSNDGYGQTGGKRAHRLSYEVFVGPIPEGKLICHHCDTPLCVNPDHLYAGTQKDNVRDKIERGRCNIKTGEEAPTSKLTKEQAIEIIKRRKNGEKAEDIAKDYEISHWTVGDIYKGKSWTEIDRDSIQGECVKNSDGRIRNVKTKLTENQVKQIKKGLLKQQSLRSLAREFEVDKRLIQNIKNERVWVHIPWPRIRRRKQCLSCKDMK